MIAIIAAHVIRAILLATDREPDCSLQIPTVQHVTSQMTPPYFCSMSWQSGLVFLEHCEGGEQPFISALACQCTQETDSRSGQTQMGIPAQSSVF